MLIKTDASIPETRETFNELLANPEKIFGLLRYDFRAAAERAISEMMKQELTWFLGRDRYARGAGAESNHRNGYYDRSYTVKDIGELNIKVPRDRNGSFSSQMIEKYDRYDKALEKDLSLLFLSGISTRSIELISKTLLGRRISAGEVSKVNKELLSGIDAWRQRSLEEFKIKYMYIDGVFFHMRVDHSVERIPMLVVIGVTIDGHKVFLTIQQGDKDSAATWREVFKDLKRRGLSKETVQLGVMDGLPGLMKVFQEEFSGARVQRCQVHVARNVLTKVPHKMKGKVADELRDIFYAPTRPKALTAFKAFAERHGEQLPSAVRCLSSVIEECLTFYSFPQEEWLSLRTTNVIERVNKEFRRRTKPMEVLAGEASAYRLLCFVALKIELNWRSAPITKVNLPSLKKFTQSN